MKSNVVCSLGVVLLLIAIFAVIVILPAVLS